MVTKTSDLMDNRIEKKITVLYADDDQDDFDFFQEALSKVKMNIDLVRVNDGEELLRYLNENDNIDIIFLDINMPIKNGKECLKEIRAKSDYDQIPVIMLSGTIYQEDVDETFEYGATLYITKPTFINYQTRMIKKIFSLDWNEMLNPDKGRFISFTKKTK